MVNLRCQLAHQEGEDALTARGRLAKLVDGVQIEGREIEHSYIERPSVPLASDFLHGNSFITGRNHEIRILVQLKGYKRGGLEARIPLAQAEKIAFSKPGAINRAVELKVAVGQNFGNFERFNAITRGDPLGERFLPGSVQVSPFGPEFIFHEAFKRGKECTLRIQVRTVGRGVHPFTGSLGQSTNTPRWGWQTLLTHHRGPPHGVEPLVVLAGWGESEEPTGSPLVLGTERKL